MTETFAAFPARKARSVKGATWWGRAWTAALEDAALDGEQLRHGRKYANSGRVGAITVAPGSITAPVYDGEEVFRTTVLIEPFTETQWARFLGQIAAQAGHIAALLDQEMPQDLADAAEDAGVGLLPGLGDLEPECDCPDWEHPCRHAAALAYQASWLIDQDPFLLLLLRGRGRRELLDELQQRQAAPEPAEGIEAAAAYGRHVPPLPDPRPVPGPLHEAPSHVGDLGDLVVAAAARARALLLADEPAPPLHLT